MKKILLIPTFALAASLANANLVLFNFYGTDGAGAYNPGGTTFNNFNYGVDSNPGAIAFTTFTNEALLDDSNGATGYTFSFSVTSGAGGGFNNPGAAQSDYDSAKPVSGFAWYDTSAASLRETGVMAGTGFADYTFDGFSSSDSVTFQFVFGRSGTGTRRISFGPDSDPDLLLDDVNTASTAYFVETTVTGATSYTFRALRESTGDSASSFVGAASINVTPVPEPSTYALLSGVLALGAVLLRRRLRS